jgi:hypothetical protein
MESSSRFPGGKGVSALNNTPVLLMLIVSPVPTSTEPFEFITL